MKNLSVVLLSVAFACVYGVNEFSPTKLNEEILSKIDWDGLSTLIEEEVQGLRAGSIEADVTNFTLAIMKNVGKLIIKSGLEPITLGNNEIHVLPASLKLTNGTLSHLSTITASDPVILKYTHNTGILELTLPIGFKELVIAYHYKATVAIVSVSGSVSAKVNNLKLNLHMGFNFSSHHAFVDTIDVKNSGSISIDFKGLGPLDYIIDLVSDSLTTLFHGIILGVVDAIIYNPVNGIAHQLNSLIDSILHPIHPNSTTSFLSNYS